MKSINRNKIVRTITKYKGVDKRPNSYEINFMTFKEFDLKPTYIYTDGSKSAELYPYKWFDIRKFYQIPAYWFLLSVNRFRKNTIQINNRNHDIASTIILMSEIVILLKTLIKLFE
jgi:hypothetical protein